MKFFYISVWIFLLLHARAESRTVVPSEDVAAGRFAAYYESIETLEGTPPKTWEKMEEYDENLDGFQSYFSEGNIDTLYSFIPEEDRSKFPEGELILIRYEPTEWPQVWKHKAPEVDPSELTEKQIDTLERMAAREQPIRYLVYRTESGDIRTDWWYESDVQAMLAETGIRVPEPTPYRPPPPVLEEPASKPDAAVVSEPVQPAPSVKPEESPEAEAVEIAEKPVAGNSSPIWPWILGALILLGGLGIILVRRKSSTDS